MASSVNPLSPSASRALSEARASSWDATHGRSAARDGSGTDGSTVLVTLVPITECSAAKTWTRAVSAQLTIREMEGMVQQLSGNAPCRVVLFVRSPSEREEEQEGATLVAAPVDEPLASFLTPTAAATTPLSGPQHLQLLYLCEPTETRFGGDRGARFCLFVFGCIACDAELMKEALHPEQYDSTYGQDDGPTAQRNKHRNSRQRPSVASVAAGGGSPEAAGSPVHARQLPPRPTEVVQGLAVQYHAASIAAPPDEAYAYPSAAYLRSPYGNGEEPVAARPAAPSEDTVFSFEEGGTPAAAEEERASGVVGTPIEGHVVGE